jgi:hypothetical protein
MNASQQLSRMVLLCRDYVPDFFTDETVCRSFQSVRVLCCSDLANVSSHSGQTALVTLVSLLLRMGMQVDLAIPDVTVLGAQPPLSGTSLREALVALSGCLIDRATVHCGRYDTPDLIFAIGSTRIESAECLCWHLCGDDWAGKLASCDVENGYEGWRTGWPIGAMASALLAANEAFKFVMRRLPLRSLADEVFFVPSQSAKFSFGAIPSSGHRNGGINLGGVDLISAGAISQAAIFALLRVPNISMSGRIFDDDETDLTNLNRNMLSLASDVGSAKVDVVAKRCATGVQLHAVRSRFTEETRKAGAFAPRVLVGVDDIPSRWVAQKLMPQWLAVSGTSHFSVSSSEHRPGQPCCGCLHPVDDFAGPNPIPTVSFVSFWAGLAMAVRLLRDVSGHPYSDRQQQLWVTPLRMDLRYAALWSPVAPDQRCPVGCEASRRHSAAA